VAIEMAIGGAPDPLRPSTSWIGDPCHAPWWNASLRAMQAPMQAPMRAPIVARQWIRAKPGLHIWSYPSCSIATATANPDALGMPLCNVKFGADTFVTHPDLVNIYGCSIGEGTRIGPFVEIQKNSSIGMRCKISSHAFI
jgi:hypothetical protein